MARELPLTLSFNRLIFPNSRLSPRRFLQKSLSKKDNDRFALYYLSLVYRDIGRNDLALEVSKKHTSFYPNDKEGYINSSIALISLQKFEEAINYLKKQTANITKVKEVRGRGFMIGIELFEPAVPYLRAIFNEKILALSAGKKIIRLLPPLVTSEDDLMDGLNKIIRVLK